MLEHQAGRPHIAGQTRGEPWAGTPRFACVMNLEFRAHFFDDARARASFEVCARKVFGLDFTRWKEKGLWDPQYTPFAAFVDGECVASLCVYPSPMRIDGRDRRGAQLLTVGTLPEFRRRGLQRELWARASDWIRRTCDFAFLFTDHSTAGFYTRLGLKRQREFAGVVRLSLAQPGPAGALRRLDLDEPRDYELVEALAVEREMVSERLGWNNPNLLLFRFLYAYRHCSYYAPGLDAVIVAETAGSRVRLHDVVARRMPSWADLEPVSGVLGRDEMEVLFCPDRLRPTVSTSLEVVDSLLFVDDRFDLKGPFVFPYSIRA